MNGNNGNSIYSDSPFFTYPFLGMSCGASTGPVISNWDGSSMTPDGLAGEYIGGYIYNNTNIGRQFYEGFYTTADLIPFQPNTTYFYSFEMAMQNLNGNTNTIVEIVNRSDKTGFNNQCSGAGINSSPLPINGDMLFSDTIPATTPVGDQPHFVRYCGTFTTPSVLSGNDIIWFRIRFEELLTGIEQRNTFWVRNFNIYPCAEPEVQAYYDCIDSHDFSVTILDESCSSAGQLRISDLSPGQNYTVSYDYNNSPEAPVVYTADPFGIISIPSPQGTYTDITVDSASTTAIQPGPFTIAEQNSLRGSFPFTNGAEDNSSLQMDGTVFGATPATEDRDGAPQPVYQFDGDDHIEFGTDDRGITDQITVSAWVKTSSNKLYQTVVAKYDWQQDKGYMLRIQDGFAQIQGRSGNNEYNSSGFSSTRVNDGEWHYITGVVEGNSWRIYVDCELENENTYSYSSTDLTVNAPLTIGRYYHSAHTDFDYYEGIIDDVEVSECFTSECCIERDSIEAAICPGESITLKGQEYTSPGIYHHTITTGTCDSIITIAISAASVPAVDLGKDTSFCQGESLLLNAEDGYENYYWNDNPVGSDQNTMSVNAEGSYWVIVENEFGCTNADTMEVIDIYPKPVADAGADQTICAGAAAELTATGGDYYVWSTGETLQAIIVSPEATTTYNVIAYSADNCSSEPREVTVDIKSPAQPVFNTDYINHCFEKEPLSIGPDWGESFFWPTTGDSVQNISVSSEGTYTVIVFDESGCSFTGEILLENQCKSGLYVPEAFSPNYDGLHDDLEIFGRNIRNFEIRIFNRWGEIIFMSNDKEERWDGMYRGELMPVGTYPWVIHYKGIESEKTQTLRGSITLIR